MRHDEVRTILNFARAQRPTEGRIIHHLDSEGSVERYVRRADEIAAVVGAGHILDWGCLYGQMTFLLQRRGLTVTPFDIAENRRTPTLSGLVSAVPVYSPDPIALPFPAHRFDAVLSMGTLEHVADPDASLQEIRRVLIPGGHLLIYNLPNRLSWIEWANRFRDAGHERRYSLPRARSWLRGHGFDVVVSRYENVIPYTFNGFPAGIRRVLHRLNRLMLPLDTAASRIPPFAWLATNLTIICRRAGSG